MDEKNWYAPKHMEEVNFHEKIEEYDEEYEEEEWEKEERREEEKEEKEHPLEKFLGDKKQFNTEEADVTFIQTVIRFLVFIAIAYFVVRFILGPWIALLSFLIITSIFASLYVKGS